jgi:hypothetical protein
VGRTTRIVAAGIAAAAVVTGVAVGAAIVVPAKAELPADAISIGTGLGRSWHLGGFSDLYPQGASGKEYWTLTDRGPNLDGGVGAAPCAVGTKVYPLPGFAPEIVRIGLKDDEIQVKDRIPLRFATGAAVGFSVRPAPKNEVSLDAACNPLGTSTRGIDSEGLVVDSRDGSFWIADEYLPSVLHVATDGTVLARIVPLGTEGTVAGTGATVIAAFPETVGTNFRPNRGFEGIAISPDGKTLYTALQSPMEYRPTGTAPPGPNPRNSLALRVFRLDISSVAAPVATAQWVYPLDKGAGNSPLADKVSTLTWLGVDRLAVEERDDPANDPNDNPQNTTALPRRLLVGRGDRTGQRLERPHRSGDGRQEPRAVVHPRPGRRCARRPADGGTEMPVGRRRAAPGLVRLHRSNASVTSGQREDRGRRVYPGAWREPGPPRGAERQRLRSCRSDPRATRRAGGTASL